MYYHLKTVTTDHLAILDAIKGIIRFFTDNTAAEMLIAGADHWQAWPSTIPTPDFDDYIRHVIRVGG